MDESALLAGIIANRDEDAPRLVYADWLEEHDQPVRAEFIRVQCELAKTNEWIRTEAMIFCETCRATGNCPDCDGAGELAGDYGADDGMSQCDRCRGKGDCDDCGGMKRNQRYRALEHRSCELATAHAFQWWPWLTSIGIGLDDSGNQLHRGFVDRIDCPWAWWLEHHEEARRSTPLSKVRLSGVPLMDDDRSFWSTVKVAEQSDLQSSYQSTLWPCAVFEVVTWKEEFPRRAMFY